MLWICWDPNPILFTIPLIDWPVFWYGAFFTLGFALGFLLFRSMLSQWLHDPIAAARITDRITVYVVVATIIGARLGHYFFYESPELWLAHPWTIFAISRGGFAGLSSHGAAIAIILALILFSRLPTQRAAQLDWIRLLDFISAPTALAGGLIRVGNFFNQEILGTASNLPWAVLFGHPADHSARIPRHPVQLYEALFYFATALLLWRLSCFKYRGRMIGLFLILIFSFRFFIESIKLEQSVLLEPTAFLNMGQILSLPLIITGVLFLILPKTRNNRPHHG